MKLNHSDDGHITTVRLSERNLRALLDDLVADRDQPTLSKMGESVNGMLIVIAEQDAEHYDEHGRAK